MQRLSGISVDCLVLTENTLIDLLWNNRDRFKEEFDDWGIENEDDIDIDVLDVFVDNVSYMSALYGFCGTFWYSNKQDFKRYDDENIFIIELMKNNLYNKYEDGEEVLLELENVLFDIGIDVDKNFIKEHFGFLEGVY